MKQKPVQRGKEHEYKVKGWACVRPNGSIIRDGFYTRDYIKDKAFFSISPRTNKNNDKEPIPNPMWGYAINGQQIVPCTITYKLPNHE